MELDRSDTSSLLAKVHAHIACGNEDQAKIYARLLYKKLLDAGLLDRPKLQVGGTRA